MMRRLVRPAVAGAARAAALRIPPAATTPRSPTPLAVAAAGSGLYQQPQRRAASHAAAAGTTNTIVVIGREMSLPEFVTRLLVVRRDLDVLNKKDLKENDVWDSKGFPSEKSLRAINFFLSKLGVFTLLENHKGDGRKNSLPINIEPTIKEKLPSEITPELAEAIGKLVKDLETRHDTVWLWEEGAATTPNSNPTASTTPRGARVGTGTATTPRRGVATTTANIPTEKYTINVGDHELTLPKFIAQLALVRYRADKENQHYLERRDHWRKPDPNSTNWGKLITEIDNLFKILNVSTVVEQYTKAWKQGVDLYHNRSTTKAGRSIDARPADFWSAISAVTPNKLPKEMSPELQQTIAKFITTAEKFQNSASLWNVPAGTITPKPAAVASTPTASR